MVKFFASDMNYKEQKSVFLYCVSLACNIDRRFIAFFGLFARTDGFVWPLVYDKL